MLLVLGSSELKLTTLILRKYKKEKIVGPNIGHAPLPQFGK
jgi:hypothetical protein